MAQQFIGQVQLSLLHRWKAIWAHFMLFECIWRHYGWLSIFTRADHSIMFGILQFAISSRTVRCTKINLQRFFSNCSIFVRCTACFFPCSHKLQVECKNLGEKSSSMFAPGQPIFHKITYKHKFLQNPTACCQNTQAWKWSGNFFKPLLLSKYKKSI